jgi:nucleotide-binding universal stress UspA family protein
MHEILVAVDGSDTSLAAARYALDLAHASGRDLVARAVLAPEMIPGSGVPLETLAFSTQVPEGEQLGRRAIKDWFEETEELCAQVGVCFKRTVDAGDPGERLTWAAMTAHLSALGAHGTHAVVPHPTGQGLGKTVYQVVRHAIKPLLVVRGEYRPIRRVVLCWDDHPQAAHAAEMVAEFGKAVAGPDGSGPANGWEVFVLTGALATAAAAQSCARIADALVEEGLWAQPDVVEGSSPLVIFEALERLQPDLVVLGGYHHAKGWLSEGAWLEVVEQVKIPVLLYR